MPTTRRELAEACAKAAVDIAPLGLSLSVLFVVWVVLWDNNGLPARASLTNITTTLVVAVLVAVLYRLFVNRTAARIHVVAVGCAFMTVAAALLTLAETLR